MRDANLQLKGLMDDEFRDFDPAPIVTTNNLQYGYINPYNVAFQVCWRQRFKAQVRFSYKSLITLKK